MTIVLVLGFAAIVGVVLYALQRLLVMLEALHHALERIATALEMAIEVVAARDDQANPPDPRRV